MVYNICKRDTLNFRYIKLKSLYFLSKKGFKAACNYIYFCRTTLRQAQLIFVNHVSSDQKHLISQLTSLSRYLLHHVSS
jgi:hypothetical protein